MTRRFRTAEHGLEHRSFPRRFHDTEHGLQKRGKPIVLPLLALLIALGGWFAPGRVADGVAAIPSADEVSANEQSGATFHGVTGKGDYYQCVRPTEIRPEHPAYKRLLEFCTLIPLPDTREQ